MQICSVSVQVGLAAFVYMNETILGRKRVEFGFQVRWGSEKLAMPYTLSHSYSYSYAATGAKKMRQKVSLTSRMLDGISENIRVIHTPPLAEC